MKQIFSLIGFLFFCINLASAQNKKPEWIVIKTPHLRCWQCEELINGYLKRANGATMNNGLIQWKANLLQGTIRIQYWPDRTNPGVIKVVINNAGFDADDEKATEDAYKTLPPACKRAEDGGGPQPKKPCHIKPYNG